MYNNKSYVTLYNLPIQLGNTSNVNWGKVNRDSYLDSIEDKVTFDDFTDLYRDRPFSLPGNAELMRKYNYMKIHYENEVGVNKDFYCFIETFQYVSQEVCVPIYKIDYHTTFGSYQDLELTVERETPDTNKTEYLFDQDFLPPRYDIKAIKYDTKKYYVIRLSRSVAGYMPTGKLNLVYSGENITTFNFDSIYILCNSNGLFNRLKTEAPEYVMDVYAVTAYQLGSYKSQVDSSNYIYIYNQTINIGNTVMVDKPSGYNKMILRYPYFYVKIGDNLYDPIDFDNQQPGFAVFPTFIRGLAITYMPINYRGESINKSFMATIDPCMSIGAAVYNANSISTQETIEQANNDKTVANSNYNAQQALALLSRNYNSDIATLENEVDMYQWAKLKKSIASSQDVMGFGLGGGILIGGVFKALGKSVKDLGKGLDLWLFGVDEETGEPGTLFGWDGHIALGSLIFEPLGEMVEDIGTELKSALDKVAQAVGEKLLSEDMTGFNREQMLSEAMTIQKNYASSSYDNTVSELDAARDAAVAMANTTKNYAALQANIVLKSDFVGNYLLHNFANIYAIDPEYVDDVISYYNYFGAYINENRVGKIAKDTGDYYYFKGVINRGDNIDLQDLVMLNQIYAKGIRLYNTTDPSKFGKL